MAQRLPGNKRERVKDLRMERGLSLSELASRVGCNETTLGRYERGDYDINEESYSNFDKIYSKGGNTLYKIK